VLTLAVCAILIWLKHGAWLSDPNKYMFDSGHDGFKNYMSTAWHVQHDSSMVHFTGMGHPYGEHVLFTDNQPIFSTALQWWHHNVEDIGGQVVGLVNKFQVFSILLGCLALFLLFRKLHLPVWYAGLGAIILVFLSPQYLRFSGHFGLSHIFVIPTMLYWLCRYEERESKRYQSLHIGFLVWFSAQLHFYYMGLAALFLSLYIGYHLLRDRRWSNWVRRLSHWTVMVIVPFAFLNIWMHWANYAPDRSTTPYGFTAYIGMWEGILLPYKFMPLHEWIGKHIIPIRPVETEAESYAGAIAFFYFLWMLFSGFRIFGKSWNEAAYHRVHKHFLRGILFATLLLVLFACGFPYAIKSMRWIIDYMGPLRQFRSQGRFTWVFFYVINTLIFYGAWNWGRRFVGFGAKNRFPQFKYFILWVPLVVLGYEAYLFQKLRPAHTVENVALREVAAKDPEHWLNKVDFKPYQALLPLPYYHIGSENIWKEFDANHYHRCTETAFHTGLPDMGVNMSRTSIGDMLRSMQLSLLPAQVPALVSDLPDKRPLALFIHAPQWDAVKVAQKHLISRAKMVYDHGDIKIMRLEIEDLLAACQEYIASVGTDMDARGLHPVPGQPNWRATQPDAQQVHHISFDGHTDVAHTFRGKGALMGNLGDTAMVWNAPLPKGRYTFSVWIKIDMDMGATHEVHVIENARSDGHEIHHQHEGLRFYLKSIKDGWGLFEIVMESYEGENKRIFFHKKGVKAPFYADEVLIKPETIEVFAREGEKVMRNNYWFD
jgi:hypothetical protein